MKSARFGFVLLLGLTASLAAGPTRGLQPTCLDGTLKNFSPSGSIQSYPVPADAAMVLIDATGASGGNGPAIEAAPAPAPPSVYQGGLGVEQIAEVAVTGGETLHVIVGAAGDDGSAGPGGGGGGSAVYSGANVPRVVAGGGGGGGETENGDDGQLGEAGSEGGGSNGGAGGNGGSGGAAAHTGVDATGAGGGGFASAGGTDPFAGSGSGGHKLPGDAAGGAAGDATVGAGGFGGGGGAGGFGGGGGGGYSGGGGGWGETFDGGGGGGSYVDDSGPIYLSAVAGSAGDGAVSICVTQTAVPTSPAGALALLAVALLAFGAWRLRRLEAH